MKRLKYFYIYVVPAALIGLTACNVPTPQKPRVELPQEYRLQQNDILQMLEPRIGRIAITAEDGNVMVMDQTGGSVVPITRDGNRQPEANQDALIYSLPVWSPDAKQLALVELTAKITQMTSTVEINPEAVIIQRGPNSAVLEQTEEGQMVRPAEDGSQRIERQPQTVIIQRGQNGGELVSSAIYVASADGKRPLREVFQSNSHDVPYMDWSPDSSHLAFLTQSVEDQSVSVNLVSPTDGAKPLKLSEGTSAWWSWNPDGRTLLTKVGKDNADTLNLIDTDTAQSTDIQSNNALAFMSPHFSPDGGYMLLTQEVGNKHKLVLANRDGSPVKTLTEFEGRISFAWSPAGARIAYVVQPDDEEQGSGGPLHVLDVNTGHDRVISDKSVVAFFWSPDGQRLASFNLASPADMDDSFKGFNFVPDLPVRPMMLETVDPSTGNARGLFMFAPTNAFQRLVAEFDRYSRAVNIWAPDSRKLVFTLTYGDQSGTRDYVLETEASGSINPRVLGNGSLAFWSPK